MFEVLNSAKGLYTKVTLTDIHLASAYYPILVEVAKQKICLTYGELVYRAKVKYPSLAVVQKAIPVSTGRRLDVVRLFSARQNLPDLTSLVINRITGNCGDMYTKHFDAEASRETVFSFDWSTATLDFDEFLKTAKTIIKPRKKVKEKLALELMYVYFQQHKATLPLSVQERRTLIVELIMDGLSEEEAFAQASCVDT
jgi:hypothetical protein